MGKSPNKADKNKEAAKIGRPLVFETPDQLWQEFWSYVEHQKSNPIPKTHFVGKDGFEATEYIPRPCTYLGFEGYLAEKDLLKDLKRYEQNAIFVPTITRIRAFCKRHNIDLASAGILKENLIARIEGIKEQTETENKHTITKVDINIKRADE